MNEERRHASLRRSGAEDFEALEATGVQGGGDPPERSFVCGNSCKYDYNQTYILIYMICWGRQIQ